MKQTILIAMGLALALPLQAEEPKAPATDKPATTETPAAPQAAPEPAKKTPDTDAMFKKKDKDGNGFLSKEEFIAKAKDATKAETAFTKKDKDSDGKISPEEFSGKAGKGGKGKKGGKKNK